MGFKSLFALNGPQVTAWALREMLGLLGRDFEGGFCFLLIGELPYRYAPLWGSSPTGMFNIQRWIGAIGGYVLK